MTADVAILGSGIIGSACALILRRAGYRVLLIDQGTHPRFALGESTLPPTSFWMTLLANRWNVPELHTISIAAKLNESVASSSGIKKNFGFVYHEPSKPAHSRAWHVPIPEGKDGKAGESHLFRQDVDAYLYYRAIDSGTEGFPATSIVNVEDCGDRLRLSASDGCAFEARFVIDASGYRSVLSKHYALREDPSPLKTQSRSVFTHMVGVEPYDKYYQGPTPTSPWHQGTLHHIFDGGWLWVIPFDNAENSKNILCSVGLNLDLRRYPYDPSKSAKTEWREFLDRFPSIACQFGKASSVRPWIKTGRIQYSNWGSVGARYWITPHAAGTVDALYSRGMLNAFQATQTACRLIVEAFEANEFNVERFAPLQELSKNALFIQDSLVFGSYTAFRNPDLLERWLVIWGIIEGLSIGRILPALNQFGESKSREVLDFEKANPTQCINLQDFAIHVLTAMVTIMERLGRDEISNQQACSAIDIIFDLIKLGHGIDAKELANSLADVTKASGRVTGLGGSLESIGLGNYS